MRTRRHIAGALLLVSMLALTGCGTETIAEPEPAATAPAHEPEPTTPEPEPVPEPVVSTATCEQAHTVLREMRALNPEAAVLDVRLGELAGTAPDGITDGLAAIEDQLQEYLAMPEVGVWDFGPKPEITVAEELAAACREVGVEIVDIPIPEATVPEICLVLANTQFDDPQLMSPEEIVTGLLDQAATYAPPELVDGVQAFRDRMLPLWQQNEESEESHQARQDLIDTCAAEGQWIPPQDDYPETTEETP